MLTTLHIGFTIKVTSLLKAVCFLLEVSLLLSGVDMSLRMSPGLNELADVEFTNSVDSVFTSSVVACTSFCSDKGDSEISSVRSSC